MRKALITLSMLLIAGTVAARADTPSNAAPADEYFGPSKQSVLEIRNRLDDYDKRDTRDMLDPGAAASLNHLEMAILDWQHKYPRDPWLPRTLSHLMREYWRAGQSSSVPGTAALALMRSAYPDSPETTATVAMVYGSNGRLDDVARDDEPTVEPAVVEDQNGPAYYASPGSPALPSYAVPAYEVPADLARSSEGPPPADVAPQSDTAPVADAAAQTDEPAQADQPSQADQPAQTDEPAPAQMTADDAPTPPPYR